jgi:hypothetical protein
MRQGRDDDEDANSFLGYAWVTRACKYVLEGQGWTFNASSNYPTKDPVILVPLSCLRRHEWRVRHKIKVYKAITLSIIPQCKAPMLSKRLVQENLNSNTKEL